MAEVTDFAQIEKEFAERVGRIVWCTVATVDRRGRPRSRILHPIWEGNRGWVATRRHSFKERHLAHNPHVSLSYWDPDQEQVYADCTARWNDDPATKRRIWELFGSTPEPRGYDLGTIWESPEDPEYGLLELVPWRIELSAIADLAEGIAPRVWRPA